MPQLSQIIQNLDLSANEAKIYLALLELGTANVLAIAEKSGSKRTSCYVILESLVQKGLVTKTQIKGKKYYLAEPPERLLTLVEERAGLLKGILPELKSLYNLSETKPRIRLYEGKEGYISICEDSLRRSDKEILLISNLDDLHKIITSEYDDNVYIPTRMKAGKTIRIIVFASPAMAEFRKKDTERMRQTRYLPDSMKFNASMFIYGDTISIINLEKELIGLIIDSKSIAQMARVMFEATWQLAK